MAYRALWFVEILLATFLLVFVTAPAQDYALPEFRKYMSHPSAETWKAFQDKNAEERRGRIMIAVPVVAVGLLVAIPILRIRRRNTNLSTL
jgi:hypothetical protein